MTFWNHKCLAKKIHARELSKRETGLVFCVSLVFGLINFFLPQLIAVFVWHMMMPSCEKRLINRIRLREFLSTIVLLSCPGYLKELSLFLFLFVIFFVLLLSLCVIPKSWDNSLLVLVLTWYRVMLQFIFWVPLFIFCVHEIYRSLRYFSRVSLKSTTYDGRAL